MDKQVSTDRRTGYTEKVLDHFTNPRNVGKMDDPDVTAKVGSVACGDLIKLYLKIDENTRKIEKISFESYGCAANIATASMLTELAKSKTLEEANKITFKNISEELGGLPKIKMHCAVLSMTGLVSAIKKYDAMRGLIVIDDILVKLILKGVLDPISGVDVISSKIVERFSISGKKITINLKGDANSSISKEIDKDIHEAFEGLDVNLALNYQSNK